MPDDTPIHASRRHRRLGGRNATQWSNCPGSVFLEQEVGPQPQSDAAEEGTRAHEIAEIALHDFLQHKVEGTDADARMNAIVGEDDKVEAAYRYAAAAWEQGLQGSVTGKVFGFEEEVTLDEGLEMGGSCDFWCVYIDDRGKRVCYLLDYKYGFGYVDADSAQLALYATAMRKECRAMGKDLDYVRVAIFQPRAGDPAYREKKHTSAQLDAWEKKFYKAATQIFIKKKPTYKVGAWCRYCRARGICEKYLATTENNTQLKLIQADTITLPTPERISDADISRILKHKEDIEGFLKACYNYAYLRGKRGENIPGFKIVHTRTRRKWHDQAEEVAKTLMQWEIEPYKQPDLINITEAEKALTKKHGKDRASEILSILTTQTNPSEALVPDDDPRPQVAGSRLDLLNTPI